MNNLYIISTRFPYPIRKGDQVVLDAKIKFLSNKFKLYVITPYPKISIKNINENGNLKFIFYKKDILDKFLGLFNCIIKKYPFHFSLFYSRHANNIVKTILKKNKKRFFNLHLARSAIICFDCLPINLSIDFVDSLKLALKNRSKISFLTEIFLQLEINLSKKIEKYLVDKSYYSTAVSERDASEIDPKVNVVPNGVNKLKLKSFRNSKIIRIVVSGNFSYPPNKECFHNLIRYVENCSHKKQLIIIAVGKNSNLLKIKKYQQSFIKLIGEVDSLSEEIAKCDISAAITNLGTGIQNKCLEAISVGLVVFASKKVIEGLIQPVPEGIILINNQKEFDIAIEKMGDLKKREQIGIKNYNYCNQYYSWEDKFDTFLKRTRNLEKTL